MKSRPSPLECWSASTMLSPASARKPLTAAISPGRSGQASRRRDVGCSAIRPMMAVAGVFAASRARCDSGPSGACHFAPDAVAIRTRYVRGVTVVTQARPGTRHGPALAHKTHIHRPCPRRSARLPGRLPRGWHRPRRSASPTRSRSAISRIAPSVAHFHQTIRLVKKQIRAERRAELRRQRREAFSSLPAGVSHGDARRRSAPASPAATRRRSPPTAATAANTSSTTAPGNRSAAVRRPRRRPGTPSRTTARRCSTRSRAPAPGRSAASRPAGRLESTA